MVIQYHVYCMFGWNTKRKRNGSDLVIWQKPLYRQENPKSNVTTEKRDKNYTTIADRLRQSLWITIATQLHGVVKPDNVIATLPVTTTVVQSRSRICMYYLTVSWNFNMYSLQKILKRYVKWSNCVTKKEEKAIASFLQLLCSKN